MGNTIRRQPISFKIPDSPDYKYLNLTSFAGLQQTDNPFTAQSNSASDVLNVYVDEQNALTTRPRVADKIDFSKIEGEIVASCATEMGWYVKIFHENTVKILTHKNEELTTKEGYSLSKNDFSVVIYKGQEIIFDGNQIFVRTDYSTLSPISEWKELYTPLTRTNKTATNPEGKIFENLNILNPFYRNSYGVVTTTSSVEDDSLTYSVALNTDHIYSDYRSLNGEFHKNGYVKSIYEGQGMPALFDDGTIIQIWDDVLHFGKLTGEEMTKRTIQLDKTYDWTSTQTQSRVGHKFALRSATNTIDVFVENDSGEWLVGQKTLEETGTIKRLMFSPSGEYLLCTFYGSKKIYVYEADVVSNAVNVSLYKTVDVTDDELTDITIDDSDVCFITSYINNNSSYKLSSMNLTENEPTVSKLAEYSVWYSGLFNNIVVVRNGNRLYLDNHKAYIDLVEPYSVHKIKHENVSDIAAVSRNDDLVIAQDENGQIYFRGKLQDLKSNGYVPYIAEKTFISRNPKIITADNKYVLLPAQQTSHNDFQIYIQSFDSSEHLYELKFKNVEKTKPVNITKTILFDNTFWYYSTNSNIVRWNSGDNPLYIPENNYDEVGDEKPLTNALIISENTLGLFKKDKTYTATPATINEQYTYLFTELTNDYGCYSPHGAVVSPLRNIPIVVGLNEISGLYSSENISKVNRYYSSLSLNVDKQYRKTDDKNLRYFVPEKIWAANIKYWSVFACSYDFGSRWLIFDDRTSDWFYWEVPAKVDNLWSDNDKLYFLSNKDKKIRAFETSDIIHPQNPELTEYYDLNRKLIKWHWTSQILPLGTINYYKKLIDTTFIVSDTEANDSYGLNYTFRAYRKNISESDLNTIKNELQYVQSVTKKTLISRFNFLQFEISHTEDDDQLNNNKLRLIGMALKYVLLGGIMQ